jgi:hypothetical protein
MGNPAGREPVTKDEKIEAHGVESLDIHVSASFSLLDSDTGYNCALMDIQTAASLMNDFHLLSPSHSRLSRDVHFKERIYLACSMATIRGAFGHPGPIAYGLAAPILNPTSSHGGDTIRKHYTTFSCFAGDAGGMENCVQDAIKE